jgi:hypothetical protein
MPDLVDRFDVLALITTASYVDGGLGPLEVRGLVNDIKRLSRPLDELANQIRDLSRYEAEELEGAKGYFVDWGELEALLPNRDAGPDVERAGGLQQPDRERQDQDHVDDRDNHRRHAGRGHQSVDRPVDDAEQRDDEDKSEQTHG